MSVKTTNISKTYQGDGSNKIFPITFEYFDLSQIKVNLVDTSVTPNVVYPQIVGVNYGISPPSVNMNVAPSATQQLVVYRATPLLQTTSYIETGKFLLEDHEQALDKIVMMLQELAIAQPSAGGGGSGGGALVRLVDQSVTAGGIIQPGTNQRMVLGVQGDVGPVTTNTSTQIAAGNIDLQELQLVGRSDDNALTIPTGGNMSINGQIVLGLNAVLDLYWDNTQALWIESGRNV